MTSKAKVTIALVIIASLTLGSVGYVAFASGSTTAVPAKAKFGRIVGSVVDTGTVGIGGAHVGLYWVDWVRKGGKKKGVFIKAYKKVRANLTRQDGTYAFKNIKPHNKYQVFAWKKGFTRVGTGLFAVTADTTVTIPPITLEETTAPPFGYKKK